MVQMEIITDILQISVEATKTFLLIPVWLVYIAAQILILLVAIKEMLPPPPSPPPPPPSAPLSFDEFNGDVILEIFRYYVSSQPDGAFILTLVSTSWRDFVLQSPLLWQWVTIDEHSADWVEKATLSVILSGACPLQIVLQLPIQKWEPLIPLLPRCQNLFFEIPHYMTGRDVDQWIGTLLSALKTPYKCTFHYYRDGKLLLRETREQIAVDFSGVLKLELGAAGEEHPNYHHYARTRDMRYLEKGDSYHPLVLLKLYRLLEVVRNASNLRTLIISHHSMDPIFSEFDLPVVDLVNLDELHITGIDYNRNGSLAPLTQSIRCPNLATVALRGDYDDIMDVAEHLGRVSHPVNLHIRYNDTRMREPGALPSFHLSSVTHLLVQVEHRNRGISAPEAGRSVKAVIRIANNAVVLRFILACYQPYWAEGEKVMECVRHDGSSEEDCNFVCQQYAKLEIAGMAVTEIDIKVLNPSFVLPHERARIATRISSQVLTTLACTPYVLLPILSQHPLPRLNTIQLHVPKGTSHRDIIMEELFHFDRDITRWIIRHVKGHVPLKVHTFGLSWFPNWRSLLPMLYSMSKNLCDGRDLMIKLPAYPHPVILRALILALEGTDDGSNSIPFVRLDGTVPYGAQGES